MAVRSTPSDIFSVPAVLFSEFISDLIEAPTLTTDKQIIYYHKKIVGSHKIVMRYRKNPSSIENTTENKLTFVIYPNPASEKVFIECRKSSHEYSYTIVNTLGQIVKKKQKISNNKHEISIANLNSGAYLIQLYQNNKQVEIIKFIKN